MRKRGVVGVVEEGADGVDLAIFADTGAEAEVELAGAGGVISASGVADGSDAMQVDGAEGDEAAAGQGIEDKAEVVGGDGVAYRCGLDHGGHGVCGGRRGWSVLMVEAVAAG